MSPTKAAVVTADSTPARSGWSEIELSGFSGARVLLIRTEDEFTFIRKISAGPTSNVRLQEQAIKQRLTAGLLAGYAATPGILHEGVDDQGHYFFDMEYVRGLDGVSFLRNASLPEIERFTDSLRGCLARFASLKHDTLSFSPRQNAMTKCLEIAAALPEDDVVARRAMSRLIDLVAKADMPDEFAVTMCHGDMTLENIVVKDDGTIVFIDLLDTFFNHWIADVAKLEQDLRAGWYTRKSPVLAAGIVSFVRDALKDFAQSQFEGAPQVVSLLLCVHLARILPYTRTDEIRQFVLARLELLVQQQTVQG